MATTKDDLQKLRKEIIEQRNKSLMREQVVIARKHIKDGTEPKKDEYVAAQVTKVLAYTDEKILEKSKSSYEVAIMQIGRLIRSVENKSAFDEKAQQAIERRAIRYAKAAKKEGCYNEAISFLDFAEYVSNIKRKP